MLRLWQGTPFQNEIDNLAFYKSLSVWLRDNEAGDIGRRELLFEYCLPYFEKEKLQEYQVTLTSSNLKVKNTLYILPSQINSFLSTKPQIKRLWVNSLTSDIIKTLTQAGLTYVPQPWDRPEEDSYSGTFKVK